MSNIYDHLFADKKYSPKEPEKIKIVQEWLDRNSFEFVLDVGCGRGHYLKTLSPGVNIAGLEPSKYLCDNQLKGLWIFNTDILGYDGRKWDGLYAMDVLEHILPEEIDANLKKLAGLAPEALYGIANHPDYQPDEIGQGIDIHLIQEPSIWWYNKLLKYYDEVQITKESDRFFIFEAHR
jgi:SAM-dependent methyltransferase